MGVWAGCESASCSSASQLSGSYHGRCAGTSMWQLKLTRIELQADVLQGLLPPPGLHRLQPPRAPLPHRSLAQVLTSCGLQTGQPQGLRVRQAEAGVWLALELKLMMQEPTRLTDLPGSLARAFWMPSGSQRSAFQASIMAATILSSTPGTSFSRCRLLSAVLPGGGTQQGRMTKQVYGHWALRYWCPAQPCCCH